MKGRFLTFSASFGIKSSASLQLQLTYQAMDETQSKDAEAQQRVISHMNRDHQDSVARFLEHFAHVSTYSARKAKLTDITLDSLTIISSNGSPYVIPLDPPLAHWPEVRERVVAMDQEALRGLNRSSITVREYRRPRGFLAVVFVASANTMVWFSQCSNFLPGSFLYEYILKHVPNFARFCYGIQPYVFYPTLAIHISEALWMERSRLRKFNVPRFSKLRWHWLSSNFIEGAGAFVRFDRIVQEEITKKETKKH